MNKEEVVVAMMDCRWPDGLDVADLDVHVLSQMAAGSNSRNVNEEYG